MIRGQSITSGPDYRQTAAKPYRWRGTPGWNPAAVLPERRPVTIPAACGTYAGYQRHRRAQEDACEACRDAARVVRKAQRRNTS